jgi:hypothetical protein
MVNWIQAWWQVRQSWLFMRHAYRCGCSLYDEATTAWSQRRYAMAYAVAQTRPRANGFPTRYARY